MLNRTIAKFLFYAVTIVLLAWTSSLTYSFLSMALPGTFWLVPLLGLVVFDVGMISWLFVFLSHAEGAIQRAVGIILCLFNFVGVGLMTISEIMLSGQTMAAAPEMLGTIAIWGVGIWTTVNVLGVLVFHLGDPSARKEMAIQSEKDAIFEGALTDLKQRRIGAQKALSHELSGVMFGELLADIRSDADGNGVPDIMERGRQNGPHITEPERPRLTAATPSASHTFRTIVDHGTEYVVATGNPATRPFGTLRDDAFAYIGRSGFEGMSVHEISRRLDDVDAIKSMRNNTHSDDRDDHDTQPPTGHPEYRPGQGGNGPSGPTAGPSGSGPADFR